MHHPAHQALARQVQLQAIVIAEVIVLAREGKIFGKILRAAEGMLAPLAVPQVIGHEHRAAAASPGRPHVLQLPLRLGAVVTVRQQNARHRRERLVRQVQIGGHEPAGAAFRR
jgi:hypothetical protein